MRSLTAVVLILLMSPLAVMGLLIQTCFNGPAAGLEWMSKLFLGVYIYLGSWFNEK